MDGEDNLSEQVLREIASTLKELLKWTRFTGMQQLKNVLSHNLKIDVEMLIYELSDGTRSTRELARVTGIGSNATIAAYWKKWSKVGIVEPSPNYRGRYQRICSLEDVGLTVPPIPQPSVAPQPTETKEESEDEESKQ